MSNDPAAPAAEPTAAPVKGPKKVKVRVLEDGAGQISKGEHEAGVGEITYDEGDELTMDATAAAALQKRAWVVIVSK